MSPSHSAAFFQKSQNSSQDDFCAKFVCVGVNVCVYVCFFFFKSQETLSKMTFAKFVCVGMNEFVCVLVSNVRKFFSKMTFENPFPHCNTKLLCEVTFENFFSRERVMSR